MKPIYAFAILLGIYALGELIAKKTQAVCSTVLGIAVLLLAGFWSGVLPETLITDGQILGIGNVIAGLMLVSLGTTIDFDELREQWKSVAVAFLCVCGASVMIVTIGSLLIGRETALAGVPIFAGGSAATLIMTEALSERHLEDVITFCIALYVTQKFIGVPIASLMLRRTAKKIRDDQSLVRRYADATPEPSGRKHSMPKRFVRFPPAFNRPSVHLAKLGVVAVFADLVSAFTGGILHYYVACIVLGIFFFAVGFLDRDSLRKTNSSSLITFFVTILIFSNLAGTGLQAVLIVLKPLLITAICGVAGIFIMGYLGARLFRIPFEVSVSLGISCTFGFPTTMLIPQEVAEAMGRTEEERSAILNYLLPKMLTAGFVTVTIVSVFLAGIAVNFLP